MLDGLSDILCLVPVEVLCLVLFKSAAPKVMRGIDHIGNPPSSLPFTVRNCPDLFLGSNEFRSKNPKFSCSKGKVRVCLSVR